MKHLKLIGLAAVAAMALVALLGAGAASATVLCKNNLNTEHCSEPYEVGSKGTASLAAGSSAIMETTAGETLITCNESTTSAVLENAGSSTTTVEDSVTSLTFGGCSTTVDTVTLGRGVLHWIAGTDNGTLTTIETAVTTNIFGVSCTYGAGAGTTMGTTVGGNPGSLTVNTVIAKVAGGFVCPSDVRITAKYVATSPTNAWVAAG